VRITSICLGGLALAVLVAGCNDYIYQPEENATAQMRGMTAAKYDVPPGHPEGDVRIASYGVAKVTPQNAPGTFMRAMHVRMVIENNSAQPWTVNTQRLRAEVRGAQAVSPAIVRADVQGLPVVTVEPHGKRTLDLFFPLPPLAQKARKIPAFDFTWQIEANGQTVAERTPFERLNILPYYYAGPYWGPYGWGAFGWYGPAWGPAAIGSPAWVW
jgi:hypothetical protein